MVTDLIQSVQANISVIDTAEENGVRSYIFAPCIVYGEGEGFGNKISIQDVTLVQAAKGLRQVYQPDSDNPVRALRCFPQEVETKISIDMACMSYYRHCHSIPADTAKDPRRV